MLTMGILALAAQWPLNPEPGSAQPQGVPASFDCAMRKAAYAYGKKLQPRQGAFDSLYYALDLNDPNCKGSLSAPPSAEHRPKAVPADAIYVSPAGTPDGAADGSMKRPFHSIQMAADLAAARKSYMVVLRGGTFYLKETIRLTAHHSHVHLMAFPGEVPIISGGVELKSLEWKAHNTSGANNIWVAEVAGQIDDVPGLQIDGVRATRARFPNLPGGIEVSPGYGSMIGQAQADWTPPDFDKFGKVQFYTDTSDSHSRNDTANGWFQHYMIGVNGLCSVYEPPVSYWCVPLGRACT